ncbi:MAG: transposase [Rhodocyclales bacterium GT-UBC]|nr:MAG: transposase [Rhodocyclales bacterium GT-UBC]
MDAENPVRVGDLFVDRLDLGWLGFSVEPAATGRRSYHPLTLLKLYVYGYPNRIQSSCRLEREARRNIELMWLLGRLSPDFKTIADLRLDDGEGIRNVCRQFIVLCRQLNLFTQAVVVIDGSKFNAVNANDRNFTPGKLEKRMQEIDRCISALEQDQVRVQHLIARQRRKQREAKRGQRSQAARHGGDHRLQADHPGKGLDGADRQAAGGSDKQGQVQGVALIGVLALEYAERAVMVRVLVDIERDESQDAADRRDEGNGAAQGRGIGSPPTGPAPLPDCGGDRQELGRIKQQHGRPGRHRRGFAAQPLALGGEQAAATGGDDIGFEPPEVLELQPEADREHRQQRQQQPVLDADQRVIARLRIDMVDGQPHRRQKENEDLSEQRRKAVLIDVQRPDRAHRTDEHDGQAVGSENEEQQLGQLDREDETQHGRQQVSPPLQRQLRLRTAADIPASDDAQGKRRARQQHQEADGGGQQQGDDRGLEKHA